MKQNIFLKLSEKWLAGLIILGIGFLFFLYLPVDYDFDGTVFSSYLRYGLIKGNLAEIIQPHHPLYFPVNYLLYKGLHALVGYSVLEYFHLQLFSLCCGLLVLWVSFKLLWSAFDQMPGNRRFFTLWGVAFIAFSFGFWYYAVEAEVHMAGLLFILVGIYLMFFKTGSQGIDRVGSSAMAALCFALAAGFHLVHGLIALSLVLIFLIERKPFLKILGFFSFYALFFAGGLTALGLLAHFNLLEHFKNQLVGTETMAGYTISYWSGSLSITSLWESFKATTAGMLYVTSPLSMILAVGLFLVMAGVILWVVVKAQDKRPYYRLVAWITPYLLFFSFWDHRNMEFKLNIIFPFILMFILAMSSLSFSRDGKTSVMTRGIFSVLVMGLLFFNYHSFLVPANNLGVNRHYQVAEAVRVNTPPNGVIVVGGCGGSLSITSKIYIPYFANRRIFILDWMLGNGLSLENIQSSIKQEQLKGNPVYIFSDLLSPGTPTFRQLVQNHHLNALRVLEFFKQLTAGTKESGPGKRIALVDDYYLLAVGNLF